MTESTSPNDPDEQHEIDDEAPDPQAIAQRAAQAASQVSGAGGGAKAESSEPVGESGPTQTAVAQAAAAMQEGSGVELPDQAEIESLIEDAGGSSAEHQQTETGRAARAAESSTTASADSTRVLEFTLGDEHYCIDISLVEEIVKRDSITRVPNTDDYIEGVVDLRGQITTILDPKELMNIDAEGTETLMIVFDPEAFEDQGAIGWIVDEVRQVVPVVEDEINDPPVREEYIRGVVDRDGEEFVIWTKPEVAIKLATAQETED